MEKACLEYLLNSGYSIIQIIRAKRFFADINDIFVSFCMGEQSEENADKAISEIINRCEFINRCERRRSLM